MNADESNKFYVPAPGDDGGSPAPPEGDPAPDAPRTPAAPAPAPAPAPRPAPAPAPATPARPPAAGPRQVYVPEQTEPAGAGSPGPSAPSMQRPASAGPPTSVAPLPVAPARSRRPPGRRRRLRLPRKRWLWLAIPLVPLLLVAGFGLYLYSLFAGVNRVDLSGVLTPQNGPGVNYLIAGSDQRADGSVAGERADTLIVMRVGDGTPKMMSIPRDLWVPISGTDGSAKINAAYNGGPARLVATVQSSLEIPIHHYVEVDFVTFGSLVDAVGGVTINFPHPAFDANSGLSVDQTGPVDLDGEQALAYVRSRHYTEVIDGVPREDPTADLGRQLRQQEFMKAVMGKVGATRNPVGLSKVARALGKDLTIDDDLSAFGALGLARGLAGTSPETLILPTAPGREGAQSVLFLQEQAAIPILDQLR